MRSRSCVRKRTKYDEIVREYADGITTRHAVHAIVPSGVSQAGGLAPIPGVGFAAGWAAKYVLRRSMPLPPPPDPGPRGGAEHGSAVYVRTDDVKSVSAFARGEGRADGSIAMREAEQPAACAGGIRAAAQIRPKQQ